jgi:osmotically inducible protein OsmC
MPVFERSAHVDWAGTLKEGKGEVEAGTKAFKLPVTFPSRVEKPDGRTSPEELIAAAHSACFAMALSGTLQRKNAKARMLHVTATVAAELTDAGLKIKSSRLDVAAEGLEGADAAAFETMAREAEGRCPVSNALRNNLAIELRARLK